MRDRQKLTQKQRYKIIENGEELMQSTWLYPCVDDFEAPYGQNWFDCVYENQIF